MLSRATGRIDGLDLARFLALIGMFCTHLWLFDASGDTPLLPGAISGKAAALFAVLAGVGIALTTRRALADGDTRAARLALLGRGAALIVIGLALGLFSFFVLVILVYYGVMFWLVIPFVRLRPRWLLLIAAAWAIVWPICSHYLRALLGTDAFSPSSPNFADLFMPHRLAVDVLLSGAYPAIAWTVYALVGMAIGKLILDRMRRVASQRGLAGLGAWLALAGTAVAIGAFLVSDAIVRFVYLPRLIAGDAEAGAWIGTGTHTDEELQLLAIEGLREGHHGTASTETIWNLLSTGPHTGTTFDLLITAGCAAAVIGLCLVIGAVLNDATRRILMPVVGAGGAPLTVYTVHVIIATLGWVVALELDVQREATWWLSSWQLWVLHILLALVIGFALRWSGKRGPLEQFVTLSGRAVASLAEPSTTAGR